MSKQQWTKIEALFDEVIELEPAARAAHLRSHCSDPALQQAVESLVHASLESEHFLQPPSESVRATCLTPGVSIGAWRIGELMGRGGMGEVYAVERIDEQLTQRGALKLLTVLDSQDARQHFERERRILGTLEHPSIAHLLDGGEYQGMPWAVMEYVEGVPLDQYARGRSLRERVKLFLSVCTAVSHAHRQLIIHRDLKPNNILVTADGDVKLLDFGIAKLLETEEAGDVTQVIRASPDFCAPEQLSGEPVSVATDVYSLGVILYELLSETRPWDSAGRGWAQTLRRISGEEPVSPSQQVDGLLRRQLRGDLDSIVLKAIRPEARHRYKDVDALAEDLDNWLHSRPVKARGGAFSYVLGRGLKRHRWLAVSAAVLFLSAAVFLAQTIYFNNQLQQERDLALTALQRAEKTRNLLARIMTEADPYGGQGAQTRISDALIQSQSMIETELADDEELQAELYGVLADVWHGLSENTRAIEARQRQLDALAAQDSEADPLMRLIAERKMLQSRMAVDPADAVMQDLYALRETFADQFPDAVVERAIIERELGWLHARFGQFESELKHNQSSVAMLEQALSGSASELAASLMQYSGSLDRLLRYDEALASTRRAHRIRQEQLGQLHPLTLRAQADVAARLSRAGRAEEGIPIYREVIPLLERSLGPLHDELLTIMGNMAYSHLRVGDQAAAIELLYKILARQRQKYDPISRPIGESLQNLGTALARQEQYEQALDLLQEASQIFHQVHQPGNLATALPHLTMARIYGELNDVNALEEQALAAISVLQEGDIPEQHPTWYTTRCLLGDVHLRRGQRDDGERLAREGLQGLSAIAESTRHAEECRKVLRRAGLPVDI